MPPPGFDDLPVDQKIDYVQSLWDRIAANAPTRCHCRTGNGTFLMNDLPLIALHRHEARPWADVLDGLERRLKSR